MVIHRGRRRQQEQKKRTIEVIAKGTDSMELSHKQSLIKTKGTVIVNGGRMLSISLIIHDIMHAIIPTAKC